jgi:H/ACA ribonucleoprotein complex non-core subunit NAF1
MDTEEATSNATSDKMVLDTAGGPDLESQQTSSKETGEQAPNEIQEPNHVATTEPSSLISAPTLENPPPLSSLPPQAVVETEAPENQAAGEEDHPEWEVDSSPIESSSDDSSDESSSDDSDEEGENSYKLLSPEEQARILMQGDGASDDEDGGNKGTKGSGGQLRTKNEIPEEVVPKPDVTITPEMAIEELGAVEAVVENILLIKAKISGEYRVLESGSVLCLADRSVIGVVSETLGRVQQPLYSVRFTNATEIAEAGLEVGTKVFYSGQHSTYVFTQALKAFKGSDASNMHDEEVGEEEVEFSDDEAEMEHKRKLKQRKVEKRGGKTQQSGGTNRGPHPLRQGQPASRDGAALSYDDAEDDGPYKPLARPSGFADTVGRSEAPQEAPYPSGADRANYNNRNGDQFRGRGRGDKGRGRGDRGRGRGGFHDRRGDSGGYSLPPQGQQNGYYGQPGPNFSQPPMPNPQAGYPQSQGPPTNTSKTSPNEYSPQQPLLWPQFPQQTPYQQSYQQAFQGMQQSGWPNMSPTAPLPSGAFINPAFFPGAQSGSPAQWAQQGQQQQPPRHPPYPPGNGTPGS